MAKLKKIYANLNKTVFFICLFVSIVLIVSAFLIPPMAVIDGSVLGAVGEIFAFSALGTVIDAINKGSDISLQKGDLQINIDNDGSERPN